MGTCADPAGKLAEPVVGYSVAVVVLVVAVLGGGVCAVTRRVSGNAFRQALARADCVGDVAFDGRYLFVGAAVAVVVDVVAGFGPGILCAAFGRARADAPAPAVFVGDKAIGFEGGVREPIGARAFVAFRNTLGKRRFPRSLVFASESFRALAAFKALGAAEAAGVARGKAFEDAVAGPKCRDAFRIALQGLQGSGSYRRSHKQGRRPPGSRLCRCIRPDTARNRCNDGNTPIRPSYRDMPLRHSARIARASVTAGTFWFNVRFDPVGDRVRAAVGSEDSSAWSRCCVRRAGVPGHVGIDRVGK